MDASMKKKHVSLHWTSSGKARDSDKNARYAALRRKSKHAHDDGDKGAVDDDTSGGVGTRGDEQGKKKAKRSPAPWEVDPDNPMAQWNAELGGFGPELNLESEEDSVDVDAILRDAEGGDMDGRGEGGAGEDSSVEGGGGLSDVSYNTAGGSDDGEGDMHGDSGGSIITAKVQTSKSLRSKKQKPEEKAPLRANKGRSMQDEGGEHVDGAEEESRERMLEDEVEIEADEDGMWVPELGKKVKESKVVRGSSALFVEANLLLHTHTHTHTHTCMYIYTYTCVYVCVFVCVCN
jgi:hypothetical protein